MVAAEGGPEHAVFRRDARRDRNGSHRETVADPLGHRIDVGRHSGPVVRIVLSAPGAAALHAVGDVHGIVLVAQRTDFPQERTARLANTAHTLNALQNHRRDFALVGQERLFERLLIVQRNENHVVRLVNRSDDVRIVGRCDRQ